MEVSVSMVFYYVYTLNRMIQMQDHYLWFYIACLTSVKH